MNDRTPDGLSRRAALAGASAVGAGLLLLRTLEPASATPEAMRAVMRTIVGDAPLKKGQTQPPLKRTTYIKAFLGFSRFDSPVKPVIGNHQGQWYCITDCPAGDAPGPIADIKAWAKRSGWPVPERPANVREFMNKAPEPGELID